MANHHLTRTMLYALVWSFAAWLCIRNGLGTPETHLLISGGLLCIHAACSSVIGKLRGYRRALFLLPYAVLSAVLLLLLWLYGAFIASGGVTNTDAIRAIAQTNLQEAYAYLVRIISPSYAIFGISFAMLLGATFPKISYESTIRTNAFVMVLFLSGIGAVRVGSIPLVTPIEAHIAAYREEMMAFHALFDDERRQPVHNAISHFEGTAIIIVGESTSRRHMSRYGYLRSTTPNIDRRGEELIAFSDVISPHSHTVPALPAALISSEILVEKSTGTENPIDIISVARGAGFKTFWLSNQNEFGIWDNPIAAIAKQAEQVLFFSSAVGTSFQRSSYDDKLIDAIESVVDNSAAQRKLAFLHLFANHWPYCNNYPASFNFFEEPLGTKFFGKAPQPAEVNCYDNGIRYIDAMLEKAIQLLDKKADPAVLMYFSDHGEAPLLGTGHDSFRHSSYHIEVPLLIWANSAFRDTYKQKLTAAQSNIHRPYTTARLYHSIADLLDIQHPSVHLRASVFSNALVDVNRLSLDGSIQYDQWAAANDYRENAAINIKRLDELQKKVWAHRINSLGALTEAIDSFGGIEVDVVFVGRDKCFHVYHPPAPDISLALSDILMASANKPELKLWLDWKNATPQNVEAALACLNDLDRRFKIRERSLVETGSDALFPETTMLSGAGYSHGYYLPTEKLLECIHSCNKERMRAIVEDIKRVVEKGGFSAITFDWRLHKFVEQMLLPWAIDYGLDLFSWDTSINIATDSDAPLAIARRFQQVELEALLVTYPSRFGI